MKKNLFILMAASLLAANADAQALSVVSYRTANFKAVAVNAKALDAKAKLNRTASSQFDGIFKSPATGVYYTRPAGTFYNGGPVDEAGTQFVNYMVVPPFTDVTFVNRSTNKANTTWSVNGKEQKADADYNFTTQYSIPSENNLWYPPVLSSGNDQWAVDDDLAQNGVVCYDGVSYLYPYRTLKYYFGYNGSGKESYGFGSHEVTFGDGNGNTLTEQVVAVYQLFDKPASPFYVTSIQSLVQSSTKPVASNDSPLKMEVRNVVTDDQGRKTVGDEVYETLTCTPDSVQDLGQSTQAGNKVYVLTFTKKGVDDFGNPESTPVVLDKEFALYIPDMDKSDKFDVGFFLVDQGESVSDFPTASPTYEVTTEGNVLRSYGTDSQGRNVCFNMYLGFNGMFDKIEVLDATNSEGQVDFNVLRVSADGKTIKTDGVDDASALEYAPVYTACPWNDETTGSSNYSWEMNDENAWVTSISGDDSGRGDAGGLVALSFTCDPLPAGTTGRQATIWLKGKGVTASKPIILVQGDAVPNAIEGVQNNAVKNNTNAPVYNLAGQRVTKAAKGILIQNGRKFINK